MGQVIKAKVYVDANAIGTKLENLVNDEQTMLEIHDLYARMMEPYVPFSVDLGNQEVTSECVRYNEPFAHYHYEGLVYGPNIPIIEDGIVVGWFSIPDKPKHPTGARLQFQKAMASDHWDQAMLAHDKEKFVKQVQDILARRAREMYG